MGTFIEISAVTDKGKVRKENQDRIYISGIINSDSDTEHISTVSRNQKPVLAVFDGMGGEMFGEKAAQIALDYMLNHSCEDESLEKICCTINGELCEYMKRNGVRSMGTTAAFIRFNGEFADICNIGDSRIYSVSETAGIRQLSDEHCITVGRARPRRVLTQHLGIPSEEMIIEPYSEIIKCSPDEIFLMCSDVLTDMVSDEIISETVCSFPVSETAEKLFTAAMENGGRDNISIIICKITEDYRNGLFLK